MHFLCLGMRYAKSGLHLSYISLLKLNAMKCQPAHLYLIEYNVMSVLKANIDFLMYYSNISLWESK